jgi:hypothetical protein
MSKKLFATQLFDAGHKSKNIEKIISKLAKGFGKECARMYKKIVSVKNTNHLSREESMILCHGYPFHSLLNMHDMCNKECPSKLENVKFDLTKKEDRTKFARIVIYFYLMSFLIDSYQFRRATQKLESNHRVMLTMAPKLLDYRESYPGRIDQAIAIVNDGRSALLKTMELAGNPCNDLINEEVMDEDKRKKDQRSKKDYKKKRVQYDAKLTEIQQASLACASYVKNAVRLRMMENCAQICDTPTQFTSVVIKLNQSVNWFI